MLPLQMQITNVKWKFWNFWGGGGHDFPLLSWNFGFRYWTSYMYVRWKKAVPSGYRNMFAPERSCPAFSLSCANIICNLCQSHACCILCIVLFKCIWKHVEQAERSNSDPVVIASNTEVHWLTVTQKGRRVFEGPEFSANQKVGFAWLLLPNIQDYLKIFKTFTCFSPIFKTIFKQLMPPTLPKVDWGLVPYIVMPIDFVCFGKIFKIWIKTNSAKIWQTSPCLY